MDYFKELDDWISKKDIKNNISENQELYLANIEYKSKVESLIVCPNCDMDYNFDIWCDCWYWKDLIFDDFDKIIEEENRIKKISEKNKWNWKKIELIKGIKWLYFHNFHWRIWLWKAEIEISFKPKSSEYLNTKKNKKYQKVKLYFDYEVVDNNVSRWESEWRSIISHNLYWLKSYKNKERVDKWLDEYKVKRFLSHKIYNWKNIESIVLENILYDYSYNPDLISD